MKKICFAFFILLNFNLLSQSYFQQKIDYDIKVRLYPEKKMLSAFERVIYTNNSPDTLEFIYFHLWPNAYSSPNTELAKQMAGMKKGQLHFHNKQYGGYIDSLDFRIDDKSLRVEFDKQPDICKVYLDKPLLPGQSVIITTPFRVKIPKLTSRLGYSEKGFEITQWYPKPAVYDRYGWHAFPYLNQGEFYSEFGNFDVSVTVPVNYVVAATGKLTTQSEIKWLEKLEMTNSAGSETLYPDQKTQKTLHFEAENVHDFAWFASENFHVKTDSLILNSGKKIKVFAYFFNDNPAWISATDYIKEALTFYSEKVGDYPYDVCSAVQGYLLAGGGMEYPTITVVSTSEIRKVIIHEVGHNWFYGILGFNEREHPFLDEGINSFYDHLWSLENNKDIFGFESFLPWDIKPTEFSYLAFVFSYQFFGDKPLDLHSVDFSPITYFTVVYEKSALAFLYLRNYLGDEEFDKLMHGFFEKWKFKHPYPDDLQEYFEKNATKDVSWFFDGIVHSNKLIDYSVKYRNNKIILKNKGDLLAPVPLVGYKDSIKVFEQWVLPDKNKIIIPNRDYNFDKLYIDPDFKTLEAYRFNNFSRAKGLFRKREGLKLPLYITFLNYYKGTLNWTPLAFVNSKKQWSWGMMFSNMRLPMKKFSYTLVTMYNLKNKDLFGSAFLSNIKYGHDGLPRRVFSFYFDRYGYYNSDGIFAYPKPFRVMKIGYAFVIRNKNNTDKFYKKLSFNLIVNVPERLPVFNVSYSMEKMTLFRPASVNVSVDWLNDYYKLSAAFNYKIHYTSLNEGLNIRLFLGSNVKPTGMTYFDDYKYENYFWSPAIDPEDMYEKGFFAHQFIDEYGGLVYLYPSKDYFLVPAVNLKSSIPKVPLVRLFFNATYPVDLQNGTWFGIFSPDEPLWEVGINIPVINNIFEFYFPLYGSKVLMDYNKSLNPNIFSHFRFIFRLDKISKKLNI